MLGRTEYGEVLKYPLKRRTAVFLLEQLSSVIDELHYVCARESFNTIISSTVQLFDTSIEKFKALQNNFEDIYSETASITSINPNGRSIFNCTQLQVKNLSNSPGLVDKSNDIRGNASRVENIPSKETVLVSSNSSEGVPDFASSVESINSQRRNDIMVSDFGPSSICSQGDNSDCKIWEDYGTEDDIDLSSGWRDCQQEESEISRVECTMNTISTDAMAIPKQSPSTPFNSFRVFKHILNFRSNQNLVVTEYPATIVKQYFPVQTSNTVDAEF